MTFAEWLAEIKNKFSSLPAIKGNFGRIKIWSYEELIKAAFKIAHTLRNESKIAIKLPDSPHKVAAMLGAFLAGCSVEEVAKKQIKEAEWIEEMAFSIDEPKIPEDKSVFTFYTSGTIKPPRKIQFSWKEIEFFLKVYKNLNLQGFTLINFPLSHVFGFLCVLSAFEKGGFVGIFEKLDEQKFPAQQVVCFKSLNSGKKELIKGENIYGFSEAGGLVALKEKKRWKILPPFEHSIFLPDKSGCGELVLSAPWGRIFSGDIFKKKKEKLIFIGRKCLRVERRGGIAQIEKLEKIILNLAPVKDILIRYKRGQLVAYCVPKENLEEKTIKRIKFINRWLPQAKKIDSLYFVKQIPRTKTGKKIRYFGETELSPSPNQL